MTQHRTRIGVLWGNFPWENPPQKIGQLYSAGVIFRNTTRALTLIGDVVPFDASEHTPSIFLKTVDVVYADFYGGTEPFLKARAEENIHCPFLIYAAGAMPKGAENMLFPWQKLLRAGDQLIFTCKGDEAIWEVLTTRNDLPTWVIPLGVDQACFKPREDAEQQAVRTELGISPDAPLLVYVGRLNIQKNIHTLLHAFADILPARPNAVLCLVGDEDNVMLGEFGVKTTGYVQFLKELATELNIINAVRFTGPLLGEDLARVDATADLLVNLGFYHRENFGLAQAEAQSCGIPIVCSDWGGFKDVVLHGETGYRVDAVLTKNGIAVDWRRASSYAKKVLGDSALRSRLGRSALQWARSHFSCEAVSGQLEKVIHSARSICTQRDEALYEPSDFARTYEDHKKEHGWYDAPTRDPEEGKAGWDRRERTMFQGADYDLYRTIIAPYASYDATHTTSEDIEPEWVPYVIAWIEKFPIRMMVQNNDPIWYARHYLSPEEWSVLDRVDGTRPVSQLESEISGSKGVLAGLHGEGLVMFLKPATI